MLVEIRFVMAAIPVVVVADDIAASAAHDCTIGDKFFANHTAARRPHLAPLSLSVSEPSNRLPP